MSNTKLVIHAYYSLTGYPSPNGINRWIYKGDYAGHHLFENSQVRNVAGIRYGEEYRIEKLHDRLFDAETSREIGPATYRQSQASATAGDTGIILIDADGDVVIDGTWEAQQPGVRKVYVL
jgi:hypothetical protein